MLKFHAAQSMFFIGQNMYLKIKSINLYSAESSEFPERKPVDKTEPMQPKEKRSNWLEFKHSFTFEAKMRPPGSL